MLVLVFLLRPFKLLFSWLFDLCFSPPYPSFSSGSWVRTEESLLRQVSSSLRFLQGTSFSMRETKTSMESPGVIPGLFPGFHLPSVWIPDNVLVFPFLLHCFKPTLQSQFFFLSKLFLTHHFLSLSGCSVSIAARFIKSVIHNCHYFFLTSYPLFMLISLTSCEMMG